MDRVHRLLALLLAASLAAAPAAARSDTHDINDLPVTLPKGVSIDPLSGLPDWSNASAAQVAQLCATLRQTQAIRQCAHPDPERLGKRVLEEKKRAKKGEKTTLGDARNPVILLPGFGGSALEARVAKQDAPAFYCFKTYDWFWLWMNIAELTVQDCWFDNLQVLYNESSNDYHNRQGVVVRAADFGGLKGMDYLDYVFNIGVPLTGYFHSLIKSLEKVGYVVGENLFGAPFDWRVPTTDHELNEMKFYANFKNLIAEARAKNGGAKVNIITHSMGGPTALRFFNLQSQAWLNENIEAFLPIAGPWSGTSVSLRSILSGDDFGLSALGFSFISKDRVKKVARTAGGIIYLIPDPLFYPKEKVFVSATINGKSQDFTASDFNNLFVAAGTPITATIHSRTEDIISSLTPPRVPTHCMYGLGVKTEVSYNYTQGLDKQPKIVYSESGDGTVPIESLQECTEWDARQKAPVVYKEFDLRGHVDILEDQEVFDYIIGVITH